MPVAAHGRKRSVILLAPCDTITPVGLWLCIPTSIFLANKHVFFFFATYAGTLVERVPSRTIRAF